MHGPVGCGSCVTANVGSSKTYQRLRDPKAEGLIWLTTNLDQNDVINGGDEKLLQAIRYADREFRPEIIIVPISCVPALIGDDVDNILKELQGEIGAELVPVHCPGFRSKVMATAYDDVYHGLLKTIVRRRHLSQENRILPLDDRVKIERQYRNSRTVNILNVSSMSFADEKEIARLLQSLELEVRFLPCYAESRDFQVALESALNVSICGTHDDYFVEHLKNVYDIPFVIDTMPIGPTNTARWLRAIAQRFDLETQANKLIEAEEKRLEEAIAPWRNFFLNKKAFLSGGEVRILVTAELLQYLGLQVIGFKGHHLDHFTKPAFEELTELNEINFQVATQQPFEQVNLVRRLKPDLFVGHTGSNNISAKQGIPILPLFGNTNNYLGYSGIFEIARRLRRLLENSRFNQLIAQHCPLPYRPSWYQKDPASYITS
jgi:nitrogenase molybdenum-iron protein alpha chain